MTTKHKNKFLFLRESTFRKKQLIPIVIISVLGMVMAAYILLSGHSKEVRNDDGSHEKSKVTANKVVDNHADEKEHGDSASEPTKGPQGGKAFTSGDYMLELTIFEQGVEPEFRIYTYQNSKLLSPSLSVVSVTLERLGRKPEVFSFLPQANYLRSDVVVEEPHSFKVEISAQFQGKTHRFHYEQIEGRVTLTDEQLKASGIEIVTAGAANIQSVLSLTGEVGLNLDRAVQMVPRVSGLVESVAANMGDRVRRGQVLAVLSSQQLAEQRSEMMAAQKRLVLARSTFDREKKLWEEKVSAKQDYLQAQQQYQEAEIAEQLAREKIAALGSTASYAGRLSSYAVLSPIDGVVTNKKIAVGETLKEDAAIFTIADLSTVWVELNVQAKDINTVKVGQSVTVKAPATGATTVGKVAYVSALIGNQTRTATARVVLPNAKGLWHPGLPVNVELVAEQVSVPIAIMSDAVQTLGESSVVFVRHDNNLEARPVELGRRDGQMVEVKKGIELGEKYVSRNSYVIKAELGKASASHDH